MLGEVWPVMLLTRRHGLRSKALVAWGSSSMQRIFHVSVIAEQVQACCLSSSVKTLLHIPRVPHCRAGAGMLLEQLCKSPSPTLLPPHCAQKWHAAAEHDRLSIKAQPHCHRTVGRWRRISSRLKRKFSHAWPGSGGAWPHGCESQEGHTSPARCQAGPLQQERAARLQRGHLKPPCRKLAPLSAKLIKHPSLAN